MHPESVDIPAGRLKVESFYSEQHQRIYAAVLGLYDKGHRTDLTSVIQKLTDLGELALVGGAYHVTELTNTVISSASLEQHCMVLQQKFIQRELIRISGDIYAQAFDENMDVFDMLDQAEQNLLQIGNAVQNDSLSMSSVLVKTVGQIEEWRKLDSNITGVPSGFPMLDRATRGWQPGDLIILAARPSVGKSALALKLARSAAKNDIRSVPVAVWSLEMESIQLALRMLAAESETLLHRLQTGRLDDAQMKLLHEDGIAKLADLPIYFDDAPGLSLFNLRAKARRLKKKHGIGLIIIDYLQLMDGSGNTREQEISSISRGLKKLAKELKIPIIALSQLSRDVEKRTGDKRIPQLSDLRESGAIEQDADVVGFLWAPEEKEIEQDASLLKRRYFRIAKARNGMLITVHLDFQNEIQVFKEYHEDSKKGGPPEQPGSWKPITKELF